MASPAHPRRALDREILGLALPALAALAADPLVSMIDTAFVGRLGVVPLGALGVNASIFSLAFVVFNFLAYGTTPMVARAVGRGDKSAAGRLAVQALTLAALAGSGALVLLQLFAGPVLDAMGATGELREPALVYLRIRALAGPAVLVMIAGHGIFRGWHDTRTPLWVTLAVNAVNLVLDPLLIFGFGWGLAGAALATVAAQWVGALIFLRLILGTRSAALGVRPYLPGLVELRPFLRVGGALAMRTLTLVGTMTLATAVAARLGAVQVAAHQIATQLWLLLALVVDALAVAGQAMVARYRDAGGRGPTARDAADRLLGWGAVVGGVLLVAFHLGGRALPHLFTTDAATLAATTAILPFVIWMQPLNALVFVWDGIFMGAEDFRFLAFQMMVAAAAAVVLLALVLPLQLGLSGVWWAITVLMVGRGVTLALRYVAIRRVM